MYKVTIQQHRFHVTTNMFLFSKSYYFSTLYLYLKQWLFYIIEQMTI